MDLEGQFVLEIHVGFIFIIIIPMNFLEIPYIEAQFTQTRKTIHLVHLEITTYKHCYNQVIASFACS